VKFTIIRKTIDKVYVIYLKGYRHYGTEIHENHVDFLKEKSQGFHEFFTGFSLTKLRDFSWDKHMKKPLKMP